jgi:hypothetical protein
MNGEKNYKKRIKKRRAVMGSIRLSFQLGIEHTASAGFFFGVLEPMSMAWKEYHATDAGNPYEIVLCPDPRRQATLFK